MPEFKLPSCNLSTELPKKSGRHTTRSSSLVTFSLLCLWIWWYLLEKSNFGNICTLMLVALFEINILQPSSLEPNRLQPSSHITCPRHFCLPIHSNICFQRTVNAEVGSQGNMRISTLTRGENQWTQRKGNFSRKVVMFCHTKSHQATLCIFSSRNWQSKQNLLKIMDITIRFWVLYWKIHIFGSPLPL